MFSPPTHPLKSRKQDAVTLDGAHSRFLVTAWMVSYEKVSVFALAATLASLSVKQGYGVQGLVAMLMVASQLRETHMAATVLLPLVLLAERCLQTTMSLGHSPLPFYSSALFAYLSSFPGASSRPGWQWILAGGTAGCLLALLTGNLAAGGAVLAHAWVGGAALGGLQSGTARLPRREAVLVAAIAGFVAFDAVINSKLVLDGDETANLRDAAADPSSARGTPQHQSFLSQLRASQITSFPHVAGRSALLCAIAVIWAAASRASPPRSHATKAAAARTDSIVQIASWKFVVILCAGVASSFAYTAYLFDENPLVWLWVYIFSKPLRSSALAIWFTAIPMTVLAVAVFGADWRPLIRRKVYHGLAVVMFAPMAVLDPQFLLFAITVATALGCLLECARYFRVAGTTKGLDNFLRSQIDDRDDGIIRTHLYLLFGFSLSMFLRYRAELVLSRSPHKVMQLMLDVIPGVIALGLVDSFAAIVGSWKTQGLHGAWQRGAGGHAAKHPSQNGRRYLLANYLCNRLFPEADNTALTHKTLAGLVGGLVVGSAAWALLLVAVGVPLLNPWSLVGFASVAASAWFEATCAGIDNLELPLLVYAVSSAAAAHLYR